MSGLMFSFPRIKLVHQSQCVSSFKVNYTLKSVLTLCADVPFPFVYRLLYTVVVFVQTNGSFVLDYLLITNSKPNAFVCAHLVLSTLNFIVPGIPS